MNMLSMSDAALMQLLTDDVPCGDLTTETSAIGQQTARLEFRARQEMVVCAIEEASRLFVLSGVTVDVRVHSGQLAGKDMLLLEARGPVQVLHQVWKTAQVLVEWASGISTASAAVVRAACPVTVACSRKNVPGTKMLSAKAVRAGGAIMHRLGLSESLLLFAEHRLFLDETPVMTVERFRRIQPEKKLVVEVESVEEAMIWAAAGADVLQLEKFTPVSVADCRVLLDQSGLHPVLAAAGGIRADNAADYVRAGADILVTSAPYSASPCDVQVNFFKLTV